MSKGAPSPWFRKCRNPWFVTFDGKQVNLQTADRREAFRLWHELALHTTPVPVVAPKLTVRELISSFLEWAENHTRSYDYYSNFLTKFARVGPRNSVNRAVIHGRRLLEGSASGWPQAQSVAIGRFHR